MIKALEKKIIGKMSAIRRGDLNPKDANIGLLFNKLKSLDEASYLDLVTKNIDLIKKIDL